ncbi:MAG: hypothetical protein JWM14_2031 [Chitinophagaceae bacterium]|nr:hypothetical protein [Chitinophagaceae bacterium]
MWHVLAKPSIEVYNDYFIVGNKIFYNKEIEKVLFLKGKTKWWFYAMIVILIFLTFSYEPGVTSGTNEFNIYFKEKSKKSITIRVKDSANEINDIVDSINSRLNLDSTNS